MTRLSARFAFVPTFQPTNCQGANLHMAGTGLRQAGRP
jgi:hypothetical protein